MGLQADVPPLASLSALGVRTLFSLVGVLAITLVLFFVVALTARAILGR